VCFCLRIAKPFLILLEKMKKQTRQKYRCGMEDWERKKYFRKYLKRVHEVVVFVSCLKQLFKKHCSLSFWYDSGVV
jgi:RecJ-like exonuclease